MPEVLRVRKGAQAFLEFLRRELSELGLVVIGRDICVIERGARRLYGLLPPRTKETRIADFVITPFRVTDTGGMKIQLLDKRYEEKILALASRYKAEFSADSEVVY